MLGPAARVRRALGCIAGAAIVAVPVELILMLIFRVNINVQFYFFGYASPWVIALPLLTGLGAAIGLEVASAETPQAAGHTSAWNRSIDLVSLILLGILGGGLLAALENGRASDVAVEAAITLAFLAFGLAAARTLARWGVYDASAKRIAPFCATLGLLYSLGMVAGGTSATEITYQPPDPHSWGLDLPTWPEMMLTLSLTIGLPVGLWLALVLWLALTLGRRAASQHPTPLAPQSAP